MRTNKTKLFYIFLASLSGIVFSENIWEESDSPNTSSDPSASEYSAIEYNEYADETAEDNASDATYVIKKGDTLWDLAFKFLGNPFDWPRIWHVNPYIKNPDLIYPGDSLVIPGRSPVAKQKNIPTNLIQSETIGALALNKSDESDGDQDSYPGDIVLLSSLEEKNVLSAEQLAAVPFLWTERDEKGLLYPGNGTVDAPKSAAYQLFNIVNMSLFKKASYSPGDTVVIYKSLRIVLFKKKNANIIKQVASAVVKEVSGKKMNALLIEMSDMVTGGERVAPNKAIKSMTIDTLVDPLASVSAEVFLRIEETEILYPFQMCILDKGSTHSIQLGDVFSINNAENKMCAAIGMIVHVESESATLCMVYTYQNMVSAGDTAKLIRRARFVSDDPSDEPLEEPREEPLENPFE